MARRTPASAPPPEEAPDETPAAHDPGLFPWLRRLDVPRRNGWLGGVCGGIAARIGVDPLLVRGIAVVLAVVGAPVALLYAIAWFLLPDEHGVIHAQQLGHGRVTRALPGIVAVFLLSFLPLTQGFWYAGALYWGDLGWLGSIGRIVWTGVLLVLAIVLVVWLARRASGEPATVPATTDDRPETIPVLPGHADAATTASASLAFTASPASAVADPVAAPGEPPAPPADASAEELANWKASQDEWQRQRAAWAAEQRRTERERRQAEAYERAVAATERSRERARIRKLTRPRASARIVFLVFGVALVAGAIAASLASRQTPTRGAEWMIGAAVATLVLGAGTVAVAFARRRSGALAVFSILSVLLLAGSLFVPTDRQLLAPAVTTGIDAGHDGRYAQLAGSTQLYVFDRGGAKATVIDLWQLAGSVIIDLQEGATFRLEVVSEQNPFTFGIDQSGAEGGRSSVYRVGRGGLGLDVGEGEPDVVLRLWAGRGTNLWISAMGVTAPLPLSPEPDTVMVWDADGEAVAPDATPTPSPADAGVTAGGGGTP